MFSIQVNLPYCKIQRLKLIPPENSNQRYQSKFAQDPRYY
jgi:hypothetical protein